MKKLTFLPIVLWAATGCGSKIIDRLDCANYQLDQINCQLIQANKNLVEGNKIATANGVKEFTLSSRHPWGHDRVM